MMSTKTIDTYILEVKGFADTKMGDLSDDIAAELDSLMLPTGSWFYVRRMTK